MTFKYKFVSYTTKIGMQEIGHNNNSLVDSTVIDTKFNMDNNGSIPPPAIE
jgi:hypothetical protein